MKTSRLKNVLKHMEENKIPQLIVTSAQSIFYLTGKMIHSGERLIALYLDINGNHKFLVNKLFPIHEDLGIEIVWYDDIENPIDKLEKIVTTPNTIRETIKVPNIVPPNIIIFFKILLTFHQLSSFNTRYIFNSLLLADISLYSLFFES